MKKIVIYGDSISTQSHGQGGYIYALMNHGYLVINYAISASGLSHDTPNSALKLIQMHQEVKKDVHYVILWHGTNDWYYHVEYETFKSDLNEALQRLKQTYPLAHLIMITPIIREQQPFQSNLNSCFAYTCKNHANLTLKSYKDILINCAYQKDVHVIAMDELTPFTKQNMDQFYEDLVHPNEKGYEKISNIIIKFLSELS